MLKITNTVPGRYGYTLNIKGTIANGDGYLSPEAANKAAQRMAEQIREGTEMRFFETKKD